MNILKIYNDTLQSLEKNKKNIKGFSGAVDYITALERDLQIDEIDAAVGEAAEAMIRFWNVYDELNHIAVEDRVPIKLYINSPGGDLNATFTIIDTIKMSKTPIYTINTGCAYSGGFFVYIVGHKRFSYEHSSFLFHEGSASNGGTSSQFENFSQFYKKQLGQLKDVVLKYTKIDEDRYKEIKNEDFWLTTEEAIELGICDEIINDFYIDTPKNGFFDKGE